MEREVTWNPSRVLSSASTELILRCPIIQLRLAVLLLNLGVEVLQLRTVIGPSRPTGPLIAKRLGKRVETLRRRQHDGAGKNRGKTPEKGHVAEDILFQDLNLALYIPSTTSLPMGTTPPMCQTTFLELTMDVHALDLFIFKCPPPPPNPPPALHPTSLDP
eukprot:jgi/Botrbrau1/5343/Bobra.0346s0017.1